MQGRILEAEGHPRDAGLAYRTAVEMLRPLVHPGATVERPEIRLRLGQALYDLGEWQLKRGDLDGAARSLAEAVEQHAVTPGHRTSLAYDYLMLAWIEMARGETGRAREAASGLLRLMPALADEDKRELDGPFEELQAKLRLHAGAR